MTGPLCPEIREMTADELNLVDGGNILLESVVAWVIDKVLSANDSTTTNVSGAAARVASANPLGW